MHIGCASNKNHEYKKCSHEGEKDVNANEYTKANRIFGTLLIVIFLFRPCRKPIGRIELAQCARHTEYEVE